MNEQDGRDEVRKNIEVKFQRAIEVIRLDPLYP